MVRRSPFCLALGLLAVASGCGAIPDVVVDQVRESAKSQIEAQIDELLAQAGDELLGSLDLASLLPDDASPTE